MSDVSSASSPIAQTNASPATLVLDLSLEAVLPSTTDVQAKRRKRFSKAALQELTDTVRSVGVLEPILVRPAPERAGHYEIVAGERRWLAAKAAERVTIPASVRDLDDAQVVHLQLIENLQREELHPLEEADGFFELMNKHGYTAESLAQEIGRKRGYVYARLKLVELCAPARSAFSKNEITLPVAIQIARIPDQGLQKQAFKDLTARGDLPSQREVARYIQSHYMLRLADASFPKQDVDLVPAAGPCGSCPKRTGNQPELFADVKGDDLCTDSKCFDAKRAAWTARRLAQAKAEGTRVIEGAEAKRIAPHGTHHLNGYVRPTDRCHEDEKSRTFAQLVGKAVVPTLLLSQQDGELIEVMETKEIAPILKEKGVGAASRNDKSAEREQRAKTKRESEFRWRLFEAVRAKSPASLSRADLEHVALSVFQQHGYEARKRLLKAWGWLPKKGHDLYRDKSAQEKVPKLSDAELARFLLDCVYVTDLQVSSWCNDKPTKLLAAAQRLKVNVEAVRKAPPAGDKKKALPLVDKRARAARARPGRKAA